MTERTRTWKDDLNDWIGRQENSVAKLGGFNDILEYADRRPAELGYNNPHRGDADAVRHMLLTAKLGQRYGDTGGRVIAGFHENVSNVIQGQDPESARQDTLNNQAGFNLARKGQSDRDLEANVRRAMANGRGSVLTEDPAYPFTKPNTIPTGTQRLAPNIGTAWDLSKRRALQQASSRILPEQLEAYLRAKVKRDFSLPPATEGGQVPRGMLLPASPNIDYNKSLTATLDPYRKGSEDVLAAAKSPAVQDAMHAAIEGMATGTGPGGALSGIVRKGLNASEGITIQRHTPREQADHWDKATHRFWANDNFAPEMDGKRHGVQGWINQDKKTAYLEVIDVKPNYRFAGVGDEATLALVTRLDDMGIKTLNLNSLPGKEEFYMKMGGKPDPFGDFHGMKEFHLNVKDTRKVLEGKNLTQKYPEADRPWRSLDEIATIEKTLKDKAAAKAAQEKGK